MIGSLLLASTALALQHRLDAFRSIGGMIGTLVSTFFLLGIAVINLIVLRSIYRIFVRVRSGEPYVEDDLNLLLSGRGLLAYFAGADWGAIATHLLEAPSQPEMYLKWLYRMEHVREG